jgi:molybdenum ABC transporter molybdate-binding protein
MKSIVRVISLTALLSLGVYAAPDECADVSATGTVGTPDSNISVASNLFRPAIALTREFLQDNNYTNTIRVCHNASGTLVDEIVNHGNPSGYSLFLAADVEFAEDVNNSSVGGNGVFDYINGIPVLWSTTLTADQMYDSSVPEILFGDDNVSSLAVANTKNAPYGYTAIAIMEELGQFPTPAEQYIIYYDNVSLTYEAVLNGTDVAGFVSKAQICTSINPSDEPHYVEFLNNIIPQAGTLINTTDGAADALASYFVTYLLGSKAQGILVDNWCYAPLTIKSSK